MTDLATRIADVKQKAEAAKATPNRAMDRAATIVWRDYREAASPALVLAIITRIEELEPKP